jgi:hypothetical protein
MLFPLQIAFINDIWIHLMFTKDWREDISWDKSHRDCYSNIDWSFGSKMFLQLSDTFITVFESRSWLHRIDESAFSVSGLTGIVIPASVIVLSISCFSCYVSLLSVAFAVRSALKQSGANCFVLSPVNDSITSEWKQSDLLILPCQDARNSINAWDQSNERINLNMITNRSSQFLL